MSKPIIYHMALSPVSRFAVIVATEIGLDFEIK
jgi:glutathione S-transferase